MTHAHFAVIVYNSSLFFTAPQPDPVTYPTASPTRSTGQHDDHNYSFSCTSSACLEVNKNLHELAVKYEELRECSHDRVAETATPKPLDHTAMYLQNDQKVKMYTGLQSKQAFDDLLTMVKEKASKMRYWSGSQRESSHHTGTCRTFKSTPQKSGPTRKLSLEEEMLLTLMKLRLGTINGMLGDMFGVSNTTVSQVINTWIKFLADELRPLILWPSKEAIYATFPKSLPSKYRNLRCTIDCTEIFIEKPRNFELQALTWSDYKHNNTVKLLVGIAPNGSISFLSKAWGGRASDQLMTRSCGFYDLLDHGDLILADRGFPIQEDLLLRHCHLEIPPSSSGLAQMSGPDVKKTKDVANARIHVERAIGRIKQFSILTNTLPITMVPLIDDIVVICAALSNLLPPLVD